jgi:hypothetical protein
MWRAGRGGAFCRAFRAGKGALAQQRHQGYAAEPVGTAHQHLPSCHWRRRQTATLKQFPEPGHGLFDENKFL